MKRTQAEVVCAAFFQRYILAHDIDNVICREHLIDNFLRIIHLFLSNRFYCHDLGT